VLYKVVLAVHFVAMIALVGGAAAVTLLLSLVARAEPEEGPAYRRAVARVNRWLIAPGLGAAPLAGVWLWSQHQWVLPGWLQYKLGLTMVGIVAALMYLHLFRSDLGPLLQHRVGLAEGTGEANTSCRRVAAAAGALFLAAAVIGTLKPGW
jgi:hypothetical protein